MDVDIMALLAWRIRLLFQSQFFFGGGGGGRGNSEKYKCDDRYTLLNT